ncbi:HAD hydrolase family protein [Clostridium malenominatum]|uniref:N-acylneuraminate cytidylyltransferase n=1 Tax=Clostridium malenominatum TaxID=1539 RepID=A0ABN1IZL2_9CLOT
MKHHNNIAFIPLRGGSKSIPLKNIKLINKRPLIYWVLDAATQCNFIDRVYVATDSDEIKSVVEKYSSDMIQVIDRSKETSTDNASTESAMMEFAEKYSFNSITLIQATSPLLTTSDLDKGFEEFNKRKYDSVLSVVRQKRFLWQHSGEGFLTPINYNFTNRPRRQEFDGFLVENGAFYITKREDLLNSKCRISGKIGFVEMCEDSYFEIDEPSDWIIVEELLEKRNIDKIDINKIASKIKLFIMDSDGVLTDGGMYYSENGDEMKKFNTKDGMGIQLLRDANIKTAIITGEKVDLVKRRAEKLKVDDLYMGIKNKVDIIYELAKKYNLSLWEIAYIGDDINDLEAIKSVGFGCSVNDGMEEVKNKAKYVTKAKGGFGAVREVAEFIINSKSKLT